MSTAFIITIFPPHYHYMYKFIDQLQNVIDLYLVFSNNSDYESFLLKDKIKPIIITEPIDTEKINHLNIITFKKFYGLKHLMNSHYDYFILCDAEVEMVPQNCNAEHITSKIEQMFANKQFYSAPGHFREFAIGTAQLSFPEEEYFKRLESVTNNFHRYVWHADIPAYRRKDLHDFFKFIEGKPFNHFDHMIYTYYLILFDDFKIIETPVFLECTDYLSDEDIQGLIHWGYGFGYVNYGLYKKRPTFYNDHGTFLIFHLDRFP